MQILLLEDDRILALSLKEYLELEKFNVDVAYNSDDVYNLTFQNNYDLYLFDINVPKDDGFKILENLHNSDDKTPVIYITALTDIKSITKGFSLGADDYLKKPFDPEELVIRIKTKYMKQSKNIIKFGNIEYNPDLREIKKDDKIIGLGDVQLNIFHHLITNIGHIVTNYQLFDYLEEQNSNALRVNLTKLKHKLDIEIKNIRGMGYLIEKI